MKAAMYMRVNKREQLGEVFGYARSEDESKLYRHGAEHVYTEAPVGREVLKTLMDELKEGDTLMVTSIDRLYRSISDYMEVVGDLVDRGVRLHILNLGVIDDSAQGRLIHNLALTFSEAEQKALAEV